MARLVNLEPVISARNLLGTLAPKYLSSVKKILPFEGEFMLQ